MLSRHLPGGPKENTETSVMVAGFRALPNTKLLTAKAQNVWCKREKKIGLGFGMINDGTLVISILIVS